MAKTEVYIPKPHLVRSHGHFGYVHGENAEKAARIKIYTMMPIGEKDFGIEEIITVKNHIACSVSPATLVGGQLGFSILSDGILNVCSWGGKFPSLLNQVIYSFERENMLKDNAPFRLESLAESGTFCCWELGVVAHEGAAWRRYLLSPQCQTHRDAYLADRFEGMVGK